MGIFSGLKKKIVGARDEDVEDVRSAVLGHYEYPAPQQETAAGPPAQSTPPSQAQPPRSIRPWWEEKLEEQPAGTEFAKPPWEQPLEPSGIREREDRHLESVKKDYEIMDRLSIMESQLVAIRSQTETINERLKMLDMKLSQRRY